MGVFVLVGVPDVLIYPGRHQPTGGPVEIGGRLLSQTDYAAAYRQSVQIFGRL